jgi:putative endonuclease
MYYVYILTNLHNTVLYTGVTNNIQRRTFEHKTGRNKGFTSKYNCHKLVYFEEFEKISDAIKREKQLKKYHRAWKEELIAKMNPEWKDLSIDWYTAGEIELGKQLNKRD